MRDRNRQKLFPVVGALMLFLSLPGVSQARGPAPTVRQWENTVVRCFRLAHRGIGDFQSGQHRLAKHRRRRAIASFGRSFSDDTSAYHCAARVRPPSGRKFSKLATRLRNVLRTITQAVNQVSLDVISAPRKIGKDARTYWKDAGKYRATRTAILRLRHRAGHRRHHRT